MKGIDYDLVIIGGTATARNAALQAARTQKRIALIEPSDTLPIPVDLHRQAIAQAAQVAHHHRHADLWGFSATTPPHQWRTLTDWTTLTAATLTQTPDRLAAAGVDIIIGNGSFIRHPQAFQINGRLLRSRHYLLAPPTHPHIPPIAQNIALTPDSLLHQPWHSPPDRLVILTTEPLGIELAQSFNRLGTQVTLITESAHLLKAAEPSAMNGLRSHLEAEGITILTDSPITQIDQRGTLKRLRAGETILEAEEILIATGRRAASQIPQGSHLEDLNLEAIDVQWHPHGIPVNRHLQTSNLQVYACGEVLGGYALPHMAEYEIAIALHNAFSFRKTSTEYHLIPWGIQTQPEFAQVGMTISQAKKTYPDIKVLPLPGRPEQAAIQNEATGWGQMIMRRNGRILGAQMLGTGAREAIEAIALAMRSKLKSERYN
jgi:pyruvate/2-oxoglutarate dehydrogenase complex dihydrolipoamide dehydrogenase (E3) component